MCSARRNTLPPKLLISVLAFFMKILRPCTPIWWEYYSNLLGGQQAPPSKILDGSLRLLPLEGSPAPPHALLVIYLGGGAEHRFCEIMVENNGCASRLRPGFARLRFSTRMF